MYHSFEYVPESEYKPVKDNLEQLINKVQNSLKNSLPFEYRFVGSSSRDMITRDPKTNIGYDFDLNIRFQNNFNNYSPKILKTTLINSINQFVKEFGYDFCEDSTKVITIKVKDLYNSKIIHSADFAIIEDLPNGQVKVIKNDKKRKSYHWETLPKYPQKLIQKADFCRDKGLWNQVRNLYLRKKNSNQYPHIKSRSLYAQAVNDIYMKYK